MSNIDTSSLYFLATSGAASDGLAHTVKPLDGAGDFNVVRGSGFPATRVNASGYISKFMLNQLLQSNTFDNSVSWTTGSDATLSSLSDYWIFSCSGTSLNGKLEQLITTDGERRLYVHAKQGTLSYITLAVISPTNGTIYATFDLSTGSPTDSYTDGAYGITMEDKGDGWYRCSFVVATDITAIRFYISAVDGDFGTTDGTVFIKNSMISIGSGIYENITTTTNQDPLNNDTPRYDFIDNCGTLLLERESENLLYDSNNFDFEWLNQDLSATQLAYVSPENQNNAVRLVVGNNNSNHSVFAKAVQLINGENFSFSVYVRYNNVKYVRLKIVSNDGNFTELFGATFDIVEKSVIDKTNATGRFALAVGGYDRIVLNGLITSTANYRAAIYLLDEDRNEVWQGSGENNYFYEATLENKKQPTSVIPRSGASISRPIEHIELLNSDLFGGDGYIYAEVMSTEPDSSTEFNSISISRNNAIDDRVFIYFKNDGTINTEVRVSNNNLFTTNTTMTPGYSYGTFDKFYKIGVKYWSGDYYAAVDGAITISSSSTVQMPELDDFRSASNNPTGYNLYFSGRIKRLFFNRHEDFSMPDSVILTKVDKVFAMIGPSSIFYGGLRDGDLGSEQNINNLDSWSKLNIFPNFSIYNYGINATTFDDQIDLILDANSQPVGPEAWNNLRDTKNTSFKNLTVPKKIGFYDLKPDVVLTSGGTIQRLAFIVGTSTTQEIETQEGIVKNNLRKLLNYNISQGILTIVQKTHNIGEYYSGSFVPSDVYASAEVVRGWQQSVVDEYTGASAELIAVIDMKDILNDSDTNQSSSSGSNTNSGYTGQQYLQSDQQHWNEVGYAKIAEAVYDILEEKMPSALKSTTTYP